MPRSESGSRRWNCDGSNPKGFRELGRHGLRLSSQASLRLSLSERFARAHSGLGFRVMFVLAAVLGRVRQQDAEFTGGAALVLVGVSVMGSGIALCGAWLVWPDRAYW